MCLYGWCAASVTARVSLLGSLGLYVYSAWPGGQFLLVQACMPYTWQYWVAIACFPSRRCHSRFCCYSDQQGAIWPLLFIRTVAAEHRHSLARVVVKACVWKTNLQKIVQVIILVACVFVYVCLSLYLCKNWKTTYHKLVYMKLGSRMCYSAH